MKKLLLLTVYLVTFAAYGQHHFGIKINAGLSRMTSDVNIPGYDRKFPSQPCGQLGIFYSYDLNPKSAFGMSLALSHLRSIESVRFTLRDSSGQVIGGASEFSLKKYLNYLNFAVYYTAKMDQTQLHLGFQAARLLYSDATEYIDGYTPTGEVLKLKRDYDLDLQPFDFGPRLALSYQLSARWELEGVFYYGLSDILAGEFSPKPKWQNRYTSLGVKYHFREKESASDSHSRRFY